MSDERKRGRKKQRRKRNKKWAIRKNVKEKEKLRIWRGMSP
jgi:hypothetical protein